MPTAFPAAVDTFTNPGAGSFQDTLPHDAQHANANDAIVALERITVGPTWINAANYATPQLAANALPSGGGVLVLPTRFLVDVADHPDNSSYKAALIVPNNTRVVGMGDVPGMKFNAGQPSGGIGAGGSGVVAMVMNRHINAGGDADIVLENLTLDGNASAQDSTTPHTGFTGSLHNGTIWRKATRIRHRGVVWKNFRGTAAAPPGETGQCDAQACFDVSWHDCEFRGDSGQTASGGGAIGSTKLMMVNQKATGMTYGQGVAFANCRDITVIGGASWLNGNIGWNFETCDDVKLHAPTAGGLASQLAGNDPYPYSAAQQLGNTGHGIVLLDTTNFAVHGPSCSYNQSGLVVSGASSGVIGAGLYRGQRNWGIYVFAAAQAGTVIAGRPMFSGNATAGSSGDVGMAGFGDYTYPNPATQPAPAATTVALANPYCADAWVNVGGGTVTAISVDGLACGYTAGLVFVPAASTIALTYTVAPTTFRWRLA